MAADILIPGARKQPGLPCKPFQKLPPGACVIVFGAHKNERAHTVKIVLHRGPVNVELIIPYAGANADIGNNKVITLKSKRVDYSLVCLVDVPCN
jgi:hypothetical protein